MRKMEEIVGKVTVKQTKLSFLRPNAFAFDAVMEVLQNYEFSYVRSDSLTVFLVPIYKQQF